MSDGGALDAAGEHRAGQGCPLIGIKREGLFSQLAAIDNQDSLVWDNIVLGSPGVSDQYSSAVSVAMQQVRKPWLPGFTPCKVAVVSRVSPLYSLTATLSAKVTSFSSTETAFFK